MLRDRALSAAVLVPPLVLVLVLGGPFIVGLLTVVAAFAAYEVFRLLRSAGFPSQAWFGTVLAASSSSTPASGRSPRAAAFCS